MKRSLCAVVFLWLVSSCTSDSSTGHDQGEGLAITSPLAVNLPCENVSFQLEATGGESPYFWSLGMGAILPAGVQLTSGGVLKSSSGQTCSLYDSPILIVTDSAGHSASARFDVCTGGGDSHGEVLAKPGACG